VIKNKIIDLNCDMAELNQVNDIAFMPYISSCNICCGAHAGSPEKILTTIRNAIKHKLKIGAHPAYPDRENFGRKSMDIPTKELRNTLLAQIIYIKELVEKEGGTLHHVKPHGALYNDIFYEEDKLDCLIDVVKTIDPSLKIYALANTQLLNKLDQAGVVSVAEAFMDRRYTGEALLADRNLKGAVFHTLDQVKAQLDFLLEGKIATAENKVYEFSFATICLHSDTPNAEAWAKDIYHYIKAKGFEIA
jgi:UPF0271 protein